MLDKINFFQQINHTGIDKTADSNAVGDKKGAKEDEGQKFSIAPQGQNEDSQVSAELNDSDFSNFDFNDFDNNNNIGSGENLGLNQSNTDASNLAENDDVRKNKNIAE